MSLVKTFVYDDFGFPITLVDAPIKLFMGHQVLDIDMHGLQVVVFKRLAFQSQLTERQLKFVRQFMQHNSTDFVGKLDLAHFVICSIAEEMAIEVDCKQVIAG